MIRIFRHYIPMSILLLGTVEWVLLYGSIETAIQLRYLQADLGLGTPGLRLFESLTFVVVVYVAMLSLGLYRTDAARDLRVTFYRLSLAMGFSIIALAQIFFLLPDVLIWRSILVQAVPIGMVVIMISRLIFVRVVDLDRFRQRVLVLGTGAMAEKLLTFEQDGQLHHYELVGFVPTASARHLVPRERHIEPSSSLSDWIVDNSISEIVIAPDDRRGALPLEDLLASKAVGCKITELVSFVEKVRGFVDLESLQPSWLIFSDSVVGGSNLDRFVKRAFDIAVSIAFLIFAIPLIIFAAIAIKATSRGPVFYRQDRVGLRGRTFKVIKFRSMDVDAEQDGIPKWASDEDPRVTSVGHFIRQTRIDEIPQVFNVLKGDMSFVGPRPERPFFVDSIVDQVPFFNERHHVKPGITGWAQLNYPYGASIEDSCRKLEYDLYYLKNYTLFLDFLILAQTVRVVLWPDGVR